VNHNYSAKIITDVASASSNNPNSWNRYSYTQGDPVTFADPSGLYPCGSVSVSNGNVTSLTVIECGIGEFDLSLMNAFAANSQAVAYWSVSSGEAAAEGLNREQAQEW